MKNLRSYATEISTYQPSTSSCWRRFLRSDCGSTLVETAISIAILLTLVIGIMEAGLMVYSYHFISNAAREGTRYAIVRGATWAEAPWNGATCGSYTDAGCIATKQNIQDYVKSLAFPGIDTANIEVDPIWYDFPGSGKKVDPTFNTAGDWVQVTVTYNFPFSVPFVPRKTLSMSSTSAMVITQ